MLQLKLTQVERKNKTNKVYLLVTAHDPWLEVLYLTLYDPAVKDAVEPL
jgi:hypothetical protein